MEEFALYNLAACFSPYHGDRQPKHMAVESPSAAIGDFTPICADAKRQNGKLDDYSLE